MKCKLYIIILILLLPVNILSAQGKQKKVILYGYVIENSGNPVPDAMIVVDGIKINKTSDQNGFFKIRMPQSTMAIRIISFTHGTTEMLYAGSDTLTFIFDDVTTPIPQNVPEVGEVVDIGYGTVRRKDLTMNVVPIKVNDTNSTRYNNIYEMIKGEVAGVVVSGRSIRIQGTGSIMSSNEPLIVVNGMQISSIDHIPPSDVASVSVLKGAAATIYGSRGSNGVIVITLK